MTRIRLTSVLLRTWMALTSVFSFLIGWAMLAHAPKPTQASAAAQSAARPLPTLAPLAPLDLSGNANGAASSFTHLDIQQPQGMFGGAPIFTTGGS
ncbi:MAG TPA: hypothetical protein VIU38_02670 [Anaerolineales bacterium]